MKSSSGRQRGTNHPNFVTRLLIAANWIYVAGILGWRIMRLTVGDAWLPVRLSNYFSPWLMIFLTGGLFLAILVRRKWLIVISLLLVGVISRSYWPMFTPNLAGAVSASELRPELRVMTFNIHFANRDTVALADLVKTESPDVIAFQEITPEVIGPLRDDIGGEYPYFLLDDARWPRLAIVSRYPLTGLAQPTGAWRTQWAIVETPQGPVVVWNVHSPPSIRQEDWEWQRRTFQAIAGALTPDECPTIVMGDLNTTDQNENYSLLAASLIDVQRQAGSGFGFTFPDTRFYFPSHPGIGPFISIDHILVSQHFVPEEAHVGAGRYGSDHYPVIATLTY